ncbi:MAG: TonB family protein [Bacteroidetes bacterium]|nr:MAG: TonB family protein [Bacteroidota bacterium]
MKGLLAVGALTLILSFSLKSQISQPAETLSSKKLIRDFFETAMNYPEKSIEAKEEGKVLVGLTVSKSGTCNNFYIIKGVSPALDAEALRLSKKILWKPAFENGQPVDAEATLEVPFNIKHYKRRKGLSATSELIFNPNLMDTSGVIYIFAQLESRPKPLLNDKYRNLTNYISEILIYPETAKTAGIQGTVKLDFVIEEDGNTSNIRVATSVGGGCDQEAIRILQSIRWMPGRKDEKQVRCASTFEVTFLLSDKKQQNIPNRQSGGL